MKKFLWSTTPILVLLVLWEFVSGSSFVNQALFPPPSDVLVALNRMIIPQASFSELSGNFSPTQVATAFLGITTGGTLFSDLRDSSWRLLAGLFLGGVFGVIFGLLTGRVKSFARAFTPIIQILRPLPPVAIIPLVIVWFGIGDGAKVFSIAFSVFFPVWLSTHVGATRIVREFLWSAGLLTKSKAKIFTKVVFLASLPFIISGIRVGISIAFVMVFVSELSGASSGLGYRISIYSLAYRIDEMIAALFVLGALGAVTDRLFVLASNRVYPWLKFQAI